MQEARSSRDHVISKIGALSHPQGDLLQVARPKDGVHCMLIAAKVGSHCVLITAVSSVGLTLGFSAETTAAGGIPGLRDWG